MSIMSSLQNKLLNGFTLRVEMLEQDVKDNGNGIKANRSFITRINARLVEVETSMNFLVFGKSWESKMAEAIRGAYSEDEISSLCLDFGIDYEDLDGRNKAAKTRSFVKWFVRRNQERKLLDYVMQQGQRPLTDWPLPK